MIWFLLTAMIGLAAAFAAAPFLLASIAPEGRDARRDIYLRQISEFERDMAQGLVSGPEAAALRIEAERRLLAAAGESGQGNATMTPTRPVAAIVIACAVVAAGAGLYAVKGEPQLASASRLATATTPAIDDMAVGAGPGVGSVDSMVDGLMARLERDPRDADGWRMLGWSYFNMQRFGEAADAYKRAVELAPQNAAFQSAYGEALVMAAAGFVTADAKKAFDATIAADPAEPRARYFRGLALDQAGDVEGAISAWIEMANTAPADAEWAPDLIKRIEQRAAEAGITIGGRINLAHAVAALTPAPAPTAGQVEAAMAMPAADRQEMIEGMVARLAERLKENPKDADGWVRLIRSRMVLKQEAQARADLQIALLVFADDPAGRKRIQSEAALLGVRAP